MSNGQGTLYVVATPIGNLADISQRAIEVLGQVDLVAAEDTRHSGSLLQKLDINPKLLSLHEHNERQRVDTITAILMQGESVALVSDAGTPLISDPGYLLVSRCRELGLPVVPVPGASAVITALSVSGLPTDRFLFEGFLPRTRAKRVARLEDLKAFPSTLVFYESSHRILDSITDMAEVFGGDRQSVVARELTKKFETVISGSLAELVESVGQDPNQQRGEFVVMVAGTVKQEVGISPDAIKLLDTFAEELSPNRLARLAAQLFGGGKRDYYQYLMDRKRR